MAKNVVLHQEGFIALLNDPAVIGLLETMGDKVAGEAAATADDAQKGAGGRIDGYAQAGFTVELERRGRRPRVNVRSNADPEMALRAYWYTQKTWGVAHLRRALYKFTNRGA